MFGTLSNWLTWSSHSKEEWDVWELWQRSQLLSHYENSEIFTHYKSSRPQFKSPKNSAISDSNSLYYNYCFGDFSQILILPNTKSNKLSEDAIRYCALLLDFYDNCKGFSRRITGDPTCISILRSVIKKKSLLPFRKHDLNQYAYDYTLIHAHTVVQFSLSTLIMRFFCNYIANSLSLKEYPSIQISRCKYAYKQQAFSLIIENNVESLTSIPLEIPNRIIVEENKCASWPRASKFCTKCQICNRVTENLWGTFDACIDCHMKRICSICSQPAIIIGTDNLPKCKDHQSE